jgi:predicted Zn-dependent protease
MSLLAGAGYNPSALIDMLRELNTVQRAGIGFGKTHPTPAQRITNAEKSVGRYPVVNTGIRQARFNTLAR